MSVLQMSPEFLFFMAVTIWKTTAFLQWFLSDAFLMVIQRLLTWEEHNRGKDPLLSYNVIALYYQHVKKKKSRV